MGRSARWIRCHINSPPAIKSQRRSSANGRVMAGPEPLPKATVHPFSLFRHLRDSFRCYLSLVSPRRRNKTERTETSLAVRRAPRSRCRCAAFFFSRASAGIKTAVKRGLIAQINQPRRWRTQLPPELVSLGRPWDGGHTWSRSQSTRTNGNASMRQQSRSLPPRASAALPVCLECLLRAPDNLLLESESHFILLLLCNFLHPGHSELSRYLKMNVSS